MAEFPRAEGFVSLTADAAKRNTAALEAARPTTGTVGIKIVTIAEFRERRLRRPPAGNGDHRFHNGS